MGDVTHQMWVYSPRWKKTWECLNADEKTWTRYNGEDTEVEGGIFLVRES